MLSICIRYTKDIELAKEVLNEGFFKIFVNIKKFKHKGSFEGWAKRIMVNNAIDFIRKNKKHEVVGSIETNPMEVKNSSSNEGMENLLQEDLLKLFKELPPKTQLTFGLYVIDGFKHNEIADKLNITIETSKWHVKEARKYLKKRIINLKLI